MFNSTCGNATNQPTKGARALSRNGAQTLSGQEVGACGQMSALVRHGTPPQTGNGMPNAFRPAPPFSKAVLYYWRGTFRSWPFTTEGVPPSNRPNVLAHVAFYIHSRAAKRPLAASLPATPALGHRRCLIVFTVFRGAANDPEMFSVADRQEKGTTPPFKQLRCMFSRFCTP